MKTQQDGVGVRAEYITETGRQTRAELVVLGLGAVTIVSITIIILAFIFRQTVEVVVFWSFTAAGAVLVAGVVILTVNKVRRSINEQRTVKLHQDLTTRQFKAEVEKSEYQARQEQLQASRLELELPLLQLNRNQWALDLRTGNRIASPHEIVKDVTMLPAPQEPESPNLLDVIRQADCIMVQGGRGAGKTNIALHWLSYQTGYKVVLDPKGLDLNPWPGAWVAQDSNSMLVAVSRVASELKRRKANRLTGEAAIYLFADELHHLIEEEGLPIMDSIFGIITFGREFNVHASFTCSDGGVKSLDIEGRSGLREGLVRVRLSLSLIDNQYRGWILDGGDKPNQQWTPVVLPGEYRGRSTGKPFVSRQIVRPQISRTEARILDLHEQGQSHAAISEEIWGYKSSKNYPKIDAVLAKFEAK